MKFILYIIFIFFLLCHTDVVLHAQVHQGINRNAELKNITSDSLVNFWSENPNFAFYQPVNFSNLTFKSIVNSYSPEYRKQALFSRDSFFYTANFNSIAFSDFTDFSNSFFKDSADFSIDTFKNSTHFHHTQFESVVTFESVVFQNFVDFSESHFKKVNFSQSRFYGDLSDFSSTFFHDTADFRSSGFLGGVTFAYSNFDSSANFSHSSFNATADFSNCRFISKVEFSYLTDTGTHTKLNFNGTLLPDTIDFSNSVKIENEIDLTVANFTVGPHSHNADTLHYINLYRSDISKFHLDYIHFRLIIDKKIPTDEISAMYVKLLNNFKERGQMDSYEKLDIEYNDYRHQYLGQYNISHLWFKYGYSKGWVFLWTAGFILVFSIITFCCFGFLWQYVYKIEFQKDNTTDEIPVLIKSKRKKLWYSLVYTAMLFFLFSIKVENLKFAIHRQQTEKINHIKIKYLLGLFYIITVYIVGVACIAYMANFVLQK